MRKIVFFNIPSHGHTNPTLGVVSELVSRRHEVWYYSYQSMREKIESAGAIFRSCDDYDTELKLRPKDSERIGKDLAFSTRILVDTTLALDDKICREIKELNPDCIVADSMAIWGKAIARKLGIPFVSSTTTFAFNEHSAKIMKQGPGSFIKLLFSVPKTVKQIKRLQNKGYPIRNILDIIGNDEHTHTIVYTSPRFQPCCETFSNKYTFVGPSVRTSDNEIKKTREKLIYISMGTVNNNMMSFYRSCISAFQDTDYQVIVSVGTQIQLEDLGELPENIAVFSSVDQIAVLKKADVFLSHCGMNSASESLYFKVPLLMFPQTAEQNAVCERILKFGAGIRLNKTDSVSVLNAVNQIVCNPSYRKNAEIISQDFQNCPGAKGAAEKIIQLCNDTCLPAENREK